jgi:hypothetical protein
MPFRPGWLGRTAFHEAVGKSGMESNGSRRRNQRRTLFLWSALEDNPVSHPGPVSARRGPVLGASPFFDQ